jgi:hypothetical protein
MSELAISLWVFAAVLFLWLCLCWTIEWAVA